MHHLGRKCAGCRRFKEVEIESIGNDRLRVGYSESRDARETPTQSHISPSILIYKNKTPGALHHLGEENVSAW